MYVNVKVVGVRAVSKMTADSVECSIAYTLAPGADRIELSTGEIFGRMTANPDAVRATVLVTEQTSHQQVQLGKLHYLPSHKTSEGKAQPAQMYFELSLRAKGFAQLWEMAIWSGKPDQFTFDLGGMRYGYSSDGCDLNWDVEEYKELSVDGVTWYLDGGETHFDT